MRYFIVLGTPAPKGSKKAFIVPPKPADMKRLLDTGGKPRAVIVDDNPKASKAWADAVRRKGGIDAERKPLLTGPIRLSITFCFKRPQKHLYTGVKRAGQLKPDAPAEHTQTPDLDKLIRNTKDALTNVVWVDDKQVCEYGSMRKAWASDGVEQALILIEEIE